MPKGNKETQQVLQRIEGARDALNEALRLLKKDQSAPLITDRKVSKSTRPVVSSALDFTTPMRAFVKKHTKGMNGSKKFTLLIAHLTKGDLSKTVPLSQIESRWNKMKGKGLLGMKFNRLYTSQARERDWVSTAKTGAYHLRPSWKAIFDG
jgi:hypothetical protein